MSVKSEQTTRDAPNAPLAVAAVALGIIAQCLLLNDGRLGAAVLYLAATILLVYALRHQPGPASPDLPNVDAAGKKRLGWVVGIAAGLFALLALWQFDRESPTLFAWFFHLTSLVLIWVAAFLWDREPRRSEAEQPWLRIELLALAAILALAVFMRVYRLDQFPFGTFYDEADNGLQAEKILNQPNYWPVFVESTNLPAHYLYLIAIAFRLFGVSTQAMRLASVAAGLITVAAAYLTGRELFGRRMGLAAAFLLAASRWDINWSRIALHGVTTPMFELLSIGLLLRALRRGRLTDFVWAGLAVGIGLCFYVPFRVFPVVILLFVLHRALVQRDFLRRSWRGLLVLSVAALLAVAPVAQFALREPETFWERTLWVSAFTNQPTQDSVRMVAESVVKHLLMFNYRGDLNPRHNLPGEPMLDPLSGALMVLGLGLCLWRARQPRSLLLLIWWGVMLLGGIFSRSDEAPHSLRAIGSLPAAYLLALAPLDALRRTWARRFDRRYAMAGALALSVMLAGIGYANYDAYFERQAKNAETWSAYSTGETITAQLMREWGDSVEYYIPWDYVTSLTIPFIAGDKAEFQLLDDASELPLRQTVSRDVVLLMDESRRGLYRDAKNYYPQAVTQKWGPPKGGPVVLYMVRVTPAEVAAAMAQYPH
jgi:4-amino-4-deoxy-L-arabinose transferase-like glycosyltransferase